jgi:hypothetical protein
MVALVRTMNDGPASPERDAGYYGAGEPLQAIED